MTQTTVHFKTYILIMMMLLTVAALYIFVGKETTAVYTMLATFSGVLWWYKYITVKKYVSECISKHDMSVDNSSK